MRARRIAAASLFLALVGVVGGCAPRSASGRPRVAFLTNCVDPFWDLARVGAQDAARELGVELEYYAPPNASIEEQKSRVEDLLARGAQGIAISPIDALNMASLIDQACAATHVITHDSDAPTTQRRCFVGCDNYAAGRACGALVEEALPQGGTVMLFIGRLEQDNSKKRRQGVIDELLDRPYDPTRFDANDRPIVGERYTILDTRTDEVDKAKAKANAEDALVRHPDLGAMVGLFAYNPPACLEALQSAGKLDQVALIGFDEQRATVQGILDGHVYGTVSQAPYRYGYESVRILAALARGDESVLPPGGVLTVEHEVYRRDNAAELLALIDQVLGK